MRLSTLIPILAATGACALGAVPAASAATGVQEASSQNWSGYVAGGSGAQFKSVTGSWTVPAVKCDSGSAYSAVWDGLGGAGDRMALEQAGTESNCSADGTAGYYAWYELVPAAPVKVDVAVKPGDKVTSTVTVNGTNVSIHLVNDTTGASFERTLQMSHPDVSSAEWIAEAPSACGQGASNCTPLSLADFGTVTFTGAGATSANGHTGPISDPAWSAVAVTLNPGASSMGYDGPQFTAQDGSAGAAPSQLSSDGSSFSVTWNGGAASSTATSVPGGSGGPGGYSGGGYGRYPGYGYGGGYGYGYGYGGYGGWSYPPYIVVY